MQLLFVCTASTVCSVAQCRTFVTDYFGFVCSLTAFQSKVYAQNDADHDARDCGGDQADSQANVDAGIKPVF